ncbi:MAG: Ig-like domain-containing protein [Anaerolineales bacterium]|nr:Ig-like domain-containing protein [Anaerolineales bacterium]
MKRRTYLQLLLGGLIALALAVTWTVSFAQRDPSRHFPETGHTLEGEFLKFYESFQEPELVFGYPISRPFMDHNLKTPRLVQYFQQARFELDTDSPDSPRVVISELGELLYSGTQNRKYETVSAGCRTFVSPEHQDGPFEVCLAFLDFFDRHGGLEVFGYPISNFEEENGFTVQYFENGVFVWHPEMGRGQTVQLMDVGSLYFERIGENKSFQEPQDGDDTLRSLLSLKVRAFTEKALVSDGAQQSLYVIVKDQRLQPVEGVQVKYILELPNGGTRAELMPPTDENGVSKITVTVETDGQVGQATIEVIANILNHENTTETSFRVWW